MLVEIDLNNQSVLYNYCIKHNANVPYYYSVDFDNWRISMFNDIDYDGGPLFSYLKTFILVNGEKTEGFIQFGLTNFILMTFVHAVH